MASALATSPAWAQNFPISEAQRSTAKDVAQKGVALSELAPNAPDRYTVKRGDTLWSISSLFLKSPWRWPELWGMNLEELKNPHLIYPGQVLRLDRNNGMATLRLETTAQGGAAASPDGAPMETIRVSPRTRIESLASAALNTIDINAISAFLAEPLVMSEAQFKSAPRIVSAQEGRVLLTRDDRAYARGPAGAPLLDDQKLEKMYRVFREATPLKDPSTGEILGYEAVYVGTARLVKSETTTQVVDSDGKTNTAVVPATIDIVGAKSEMRVGDRLFPEPVKQLQSYSPRAPGGKVDGRIVSIYGAAVANASQSQVVSINRGTQDGMEVGHVLAILKDGAQSVDQSDQSKPLMKLPNERNGLLMVFLTFERLSYAVILELADGARVGDRVVNPR